MKIQPSLSVNALSGRNSGGVHTKNGYARKMAVPKNRRSATQQSTRSTFTTNSRAWASLTDAQRTAWNTAAPNFPYSDVFGQRRLLSGKALYNKLNNNIVLGGGSAISTPPTPAAVSAVTSAAFGSNTNALQTVVFAASPAPANTAYIIKMTAPLSVGNMTPGKSKYRRIQVVAPAGTTPANTFAAYSTVNGTPVTGKKIFGQMFSVNLLTGQVSPALSFSGTTA